MSIKNLAPPDSPSGCHFPFDRPFDKLTVLSNVDGLMALSKAEGGDVSCFGSSSFDLEALDRLRYI